MVLTVYDWVYGSSQLGAVFLSIIAGLLALSMFRVSRRVKVLNAWRWLIIALILFALIEVEGALHTFGIYSNPYWTHVTASIILIVLMGALIRQTQINQGWVA